MARDKGLEELVRSELGGTRGLSEKAMFGGLAWMLHGNLLVAARHDGMLARVGKENEKWALKTPGVAPMILGERRMSGWVKAGADAYGEDAVRRKLIASAVAFVSALPEK